MPTVTPTALLMPTVTPTALLIPTRPLKQAPITTLPTPGQL